MVIKRGQLQIQQLAFLIVAIFLFFIIVGLFFLNVSMGSIKGSAQDLKTEKAISFLSTIPSMTEFNANCANCVDKDKLKAFIYFSKEYKQFFPLDSLRALKIYPKPENFSISDELLCPSSECIILFNSTKPEIVEYSIFVPVCETSKRTGIVITDCEIWKLIGGVEFIE